MAVIRQVKKIVHYNMDVSEDELRCILDSIAYRGLYISEHSNYKWKAEAVQLMPQIKGALRNG